jgi:hypothetical protein
VAAFRIATSSRSRRFSARIRRISSFSSIVTPGASPPSISAWATQRHNDFCLPRPAWTPPAPPRYLVGYSARCYSTSRTARALSSGSNFFGMTCILPTQKDAASYACLRGVVETLVETLEHVPDAERPAHLSVVPPEVGNALWPAETWLLFAYRRLAEDRGFEPLRG